MQVYPSAATLKQFGSPGSPVAGSVYYRGYCPGCGEPIRVNDPDLALCTYCRGCELKPQTGGPPSPRLADGSDDDGQGTFLSHAITAADQHRRL